MRWPALAAAALAAFAVPSFARADGQQASSGPATALLSYQRQATDLYPLYSDLRIAILRDGQQVYSSSLYDKQCEDQYCHPANDDKQSVFVVDLDADGEPEVIVDLRLGGAHDRCYTDFYRWVPPTYVPFKWAFQEPCYTIVQLDSTPQPELLTADYRFTGRFATSTAAIAAALRIWNYQRGRLVDVTSHFPGRLRADARLMWKSFRRYAATEDGALSPLAAWTMDEYELGRRRSALRTLRRLNREGRIRNGYGRILHVPTGARFIRVVDHYLRAHV
jgi:hypothetical protein